MIGKGSKVQVHYSVVEGDRADAGLNKAFDLIFAKCLDFPDNETRNCLDARGVKVGENLPLDKVVGRSL